jgi:transposase
MNHEIMIKWLIRIYKEQVNLIQHHPQQESILFMDNMGAHDHDDVRAVLAQHGIRAEFLPPNCTPMLQPLDHSLNASFKREYENQWAAWFHETGSKRLTKHGAKKKATKNDVNRWVTAAFHRITADHVRSCWRHTLMLQPSLLILPATVFDRIASFLDQRVMKPSIAMIAAHRTKHDGNRMPMPERLNKRKRRDNDDDNDNATHRQRMQ